MTDVVDTHASGTVPSRVPARPARLPGLDGIRALAVVAVFVYHLYPAALPGGYLGVDLFFVLSGYLITRQLVAERARDGRVALGRFWSRRARRILPALLPVLVATTVGVAAIDPSGLRALRAELLGAASFTSNWLQIAQQHSYFARFSPPSVLQHLWSLAVEEQFYLVWPLLAVLVLRRAAARRLALFAAVAAAASALLMGLLREPGGDPSRVYFGTDTHCFGLLLGAVVAVAWPGAAPPRTSLRRPASMLGIAIVAAGLGLLGEYRAVTYRGGMLVVCAGAALLMVGAGHPVGAVGRVLALRPVRWVGDRSYGLYLWHWPVLLLGDRIVEHRTPLVAAAEVFVAVSLSALSYRYLERPVLRNGLRQAVAGLRRGVRRGYGAELAIGAVTAVVLVSVAVLSLLRVPAPPDAGLRSQLAAGRAALRSSPSPSGAPSPSAAAAGVAPKPSAAPTPVRLPVGKQITALGDSVMLAAAPALAHALPGISVDAVVSRYMQAAPHLLDAKADGGQLRHIVVLGLGTNGPFPRRLLEGVVHRIGPDRQLYLVDVWVPTRSWESTVNRTLAAVAAAHRNVHMVHWRSAIARRQNLLWSDHIHPRPGAGTRLYATALVDALTASARGD